MYPIFNETLCNSVMISFGGRLKINMESSQNKKSQLNWDLVARPRFELGTSAL
jgi:hypothetical protein